MKWLIAIVATTTLASCSTRAEPVWTFKSSQPITAAAVLGKSKQLAVVTRAGISILNADTGQEIGKVPGVGVDLRAIACTSTTCWVGGGEHEKGYFGVVDIQRREIKQLAPSNNLAAINAIALRADEMLVTGHSDESVILWDAKGEQPKRTLIVHEGTEIDAVGFMGANVLAGNSAGDVVVWDGISEMPAQRMNLGDAVLSITLIGENAFVGGWQHLDILDAKNLSKKKRIDVDHAAIGPCDVGDGQIVWCGQSDGSLVQIETNGVRKGSFKGHSDSIRFVKLLDGVVITASKDKTVKAWKENQIASGSGK